MTQDKGASASADRAVVDGAGQAVSAVPASVPSAAMRQTFPLLDGAVSRGHSLTPHPADGTVAHVDCGGGAMMSIPDPTADTALEWTLRYGNPESVRFTVASVLSSYDYLIRGCHSTKEAQRRVALLRRAVSKLWDEGPLPPRPAQVVEARKAADAPETNTSPGDSE